MRKIMLAAMAALAITGCSQNEEFDAPSQNAEIGVGAVVKNTTRAGVTNNGNFKKFTVYSYITEGIYAPENTLGEAYMNGVNYSFETEWTNDGGKYYWPAAASTKKLQFFAYPTDLIDAGSYAAPATGYPSFTYTVAAKSADQKDLVVANKANMASNNVGVSNGTFQLDFTHALTRINFAFIPAEADFTYTIESITVNGVKGGTGKYTFVSGWNLDNATANISYNYPITQATSKVEGKDYFLLGDANASLMLLPQAVTDVNIAITYKVGNAKMDIFNGTKTISLNTATAWGVGQNILYKLTLPTGGDLVGITPDVSGWPSETETPIAPAN